MMKETEAEMHPHPDFLHCHTDGALLTEGQLRCPKAGPESGGHGVGVGDVGCAQRGRNADALQSVKGQGGHEAGAVPASAQGHFRQAPGLWLIPEQYLCQASPQSAF